MWMYWLDGKNPFELQERAKLADIKEKDGLVWIALKAMSQLFKFFFSTPSVLLAANNMPPNLPAAVNSSSSLFSTFAWSSVLKCRDCVAVVVGLSVLAAFSRRHLPTVASSSLSCHHGLHHTPRRQRPSFSSSRSSALCRCGRRREVSVVVVVGVVVVVVRVVIDVVVVPRHRVVVMSSFRDIRQRRGILELVVAVVVVVGVAAIVLQSRRPRRSSYGRRQVGVGVTWNPASSPHTCSA